MKDTQSNQRTRFTNFMSPMTNELNAAAEQHAVFLRARSECTSFGSWEALDMILPSPTGQPNSLPTTSDIESMPQLAVKTQFKPIVMLDAPKIDSGPYSCNEIKAKSHLSKSEMSCGHSVQHENDNVTMGDLAVRVQNIVNVNK